MQNRICSCQNSSRIGSVVGERYELVSELGQGGMGAIYKARHINQAKLYAVKILSPELSKDEAFVARFLQEAKTSSLLNHPNLVRIAQYGTTVYGETFLVMDFIDGRSLADLLTVVQRLEQKQALHIFAQICGGLGHAHDLGVVHRDLKPSNVMLTFTKGGADFVKIVDFGIAKMVSGNGSAGHATQALTKAGQFVGSPLYMSPEQGSGGKIDHRTDIYSMGILMYECLTGNPPFRGENFFVTMMMHGDLEPSPFPMSLGISPQLEKIVFRALQKNPDNRYQTMEEMRRDLISVSNEEGEVAPTKNAFKKSTMSQAQEQTAREEKKQNKSVLKALGFLAGILIVAGAGTYFLQHKIQTSKAQPQAPGTSQSQSGDVPTANPVSSAKKAQEQGRPEAFTAREPAATKADPDNKLHLPPISPQATMPEQDHGLSALALKEKGADLARQITTNWQDPLPALYLTAAIQADPKDADAYQKLGGYYWDQKERAPQSAKTDLLEKCRLVYSEEIKQLPDNFEARSLRSSVEIEQHLYQAALTDITAALKMHPDNHELLLRHAYVQREMHLYQQAINEYEKNIGPQDVDQMFVEGMCYEDLKQYDKAIAFATKWIKKLGEAPYLYQVRADSERMLGRYKEAFLDYQNMTDSQKQERNDWIEECRVKMTLPVRDDHQNDQVPSSQ